MKAIMGFAVALTLASVSADTETFAFYSFRDGAAGESAVGVVTNSVQEADSEETYEGMVTEAGSLPHVVFSDDAPGLYVYETSHADAALLGDHPQSIQLGSGACEVSTGTLKIQSAGPRLSRCHAGGFTIEFFFKISPEDTWSAWSAMFSFDCGYKFGSSRPSFFVYMPCDNASSLRHGLGGYNASAGLGGKSTLAYPLNDGKWHHFAAVESRSAGDPVLTLYVDGNVCATYSNLASSGVELTVDDNGTGIELGRNNVSWKMSCLRLTARPRSVDEFMAVTSRSAVAVPAGTLAFYPFDDDVPLASAVGKTVFNAANPMVHAGTVTLANESTASAVFDADAPAKYIFHGEHYGSSPLYTNPASVHVSSDVAGKSASIALSDLGRELSKHHADGITVEYFIKLDDNAFEGFTSSFNLQAGYVKDSTAMSVDLYMPFDMGASYGNGRQFRFAIGGYSSGYKAITTVDYDLWDQTWHHVALVGQGRTVKLFVDYIEKCSVTADDAVELTTVADLVLGRNVHHAKYSCLRATVRALSAAEFLRASDFDTYWPKTAMYQTFDRSGDVSMAMPTVLTNDAPSFADVNAGIYAAMVSGASGELKVYNMTATTPLYADNRPYRLATVSGEVFHTNRHSAAFVSTSIGEDYFRDGAYLQLGAGQSDGLVSEDFTCEGFFRFDNKGWNETSSTFALGRPRMTLMGFRPTVGDARWALTVNDLSTGMHRFSLAGRAGDDVVAWSDPTFADGGWHHVAVTYEATATQLVAYCDYKPVVTNILSAPFGLTGGDFMFGCGEGFNNNAFQGWMDELRCSRGALPSSEFLRMNRIPLGLAIIVK